MIVKSSLSAAALAAAVFVAGCQTTDRDWAAQKCQELGRGGADLQSCIAEQRAWLDYNRAVARSGRP